MPKFSTNLVEIHAALCKPLELSAHPVWHTSPNWEENVEGKHFLRHCSIIWTDLFSPWALLWNHLRSQGMPSLRAKHDLAASHCPGPEHLIPVPLRAQCWPEGNDFLLTWVYSSGCIQIQPGRVWPGCQSLQVLLYWVSQCVTAQRWRAGLSPMVSGNAKTKRTGFQDNNKQSSLKILQGSFSEDTV